MSKNLLPFEKLDRTFLVKKESTTDSSYGKNPSERTIEENINYGIVVIDKPPGPTSHQVADFVKKILHLEKAGHSGTLDPAVTGVLPVGLQKATRIMQSLLTAGKEYVCLMHIHDEISKEKILETMKEYQGKIKQLPPVKSAVKRQLRERNVYYVEAIEIEGQDVLFKIGCEAGTYIRKWVHDFGLKLGTNAHMVELRRTKSGPFTEENITTLQDLADAYHYYHVEKDYSKLKKILVTPEFAVSHLKKIYVMDSTVNSLCHGAYLKVPGIVKLEKNIVKHDPIAIFTLKEELILVGTAMMNAEDIMNSDKGIVAQTQQVFMDPNIYPKIN